MNFTQLPRIYAKSAADYVRKHQKKTFITLYKKTNGNIVVYDTIIKNNTIVDINIYWLDVDPTYRKTNTLHPLQLNCIEKKFYGIHVVQKVSPTRWIIQFKKDTHHIILNYDINTETSAAYVKIHKDIHKIQTIYVNDNIKYKLIPSVKSIYLNTNTKDDTQHSINIYSS